MDQAVEIPTELAFTSEDIKAAATEINDIEEQSLRTRTLMVALVVLKRFFKGDLALWNQYNEGSRAVAALAEELKTSDSPWTARRIFYAVRMHEQDVAHGGLKRWPKLTVTHFEEVQKLPFDRQRELLDQAAEKHLSTRQLRALVQAKGGSSFDITVDVPADEKKQSIKDLLRFGSRAEKLCAECEEVAADLDRADVPDAVADRLKATLEDLQNQIAALRGLLKPSEGGPLKPSESKDTKPEPSPIR